MWANIEFFTVISVISVCYLVFPKNYTAYTYTDRGQLWPNQYY